MSKTLKERLEERWKPARDEAARKELEKLFPMPPVVRRKQKSEFEKMFPHRKPHWEGFPYNRGSAPDARPFEPVPPDEMKAAGWSMTYERDGYRLR
jgi:hypothetical protein